MSAISFPQARIETGAQRRALTVGWRALVALTVLTVMFIPVRRYTLTSSLPFAVEPYRVVLAFVILVWICALLIDPRVKLRSLRFDGVFLSYLFVIFVSMLLNMGRVSSVAPVLTKRVTLFLSLFFVVYLIASTTRRYVDKLALAKVIAGGGAVLAAFAIFEARTHHNVFDNLPRILPFLQVHQLIFVGASTDGRGATHRAIASAESPIELGAILTMIIPIAIAVAIQTRSKRWWFAVAILIPGAVSSVSRTVILMMLALLVVFLWLRPREMMRCWPAILPLAVAVHLAVPGTLGTLGNAFFPKGGLVAQQTDTSVGSGRLATLWPALHTEFDPNPVFGEGFATRVTTPEDPRVPPNAPITDDQWLGVLLETGLVGIAVFVLLIGTVVRRLGRAAKRDRTARGWLCVGTAAAVTSYAVGMLTFDSFTFYEVTFLFFTVLGLSATLLAPDEVDEPEMALGSGPRSRTLAPAPNPRLVTE